MQTGWARANKGDVGATQPYLVEVHICLEDGFTNLFAVVCCV